MNEIETRFRGVENSPPPTEQQQLSVSQIRDAVTKLALIIDAQSAHPRYKNTALTHLEAAAMFAVKGVFQ